MSDIKTSLLHFLNTDQNLGDSVDRKAILEYMSAKHDLQDVTAFLTKYCEDAILSRAPIVYRTDHLINYVGFTESKIDTQKSKPTAFHAIDGRGDTRQPDIIKTKSYRELESLISPKYPINIYISGETGLGKSTAVFAIASKFNKPVIRVNMSGATDIDDLIGGIRIVDGNTIFDAGPVALAMEQGAILLLDEVDAGKAQILIDLHPVLELKGVLAKKARKMIYPAPGFCVIATGNTKGVGDESGKYIGTNNMNHAFLQRFGAAVEFIPPTTEEMEEILSQRLPDLSTCIRKNLCLWYTHVLDCYVGGTVTEYINPRKMIDIGNVCLIFGARSGTDTSTVAAIKAAISLYEQPLIEALVQLYSTMMRDLSTKEQVIDSIAKEPSRTDENGNYIPF